MDRKPKIEIKIPNDIFKEEKKPEKYTSRGMVNDIANKVYQVIDSKETSKGNAWRNVLMKMA